MLNHSINRSTFRENGWLGRWRGRWPAACRGYWGTAAASLRIVRTRFLKALILNWAYKIFESIKSIVGVNIMAQSQYGAFRVNIAQKILWYIKNIDILEPQILPYGRSTKVKVFLFFFKCGSNWGIIYEGVKTHILKNIFEFARRFNIVFSRKAV